MHVGEYGIELRIDIGETVDGATDVKIFYITPSGNIGYWDATLEGNEVVYTTKDGDINEAGNWILQPRLKGSGYQIYGEKIFIYVKQAPQEGDT